MSPVYFFVSLLKEQKKEKAKHEGFAKKIITNKNMTYPQKDQNFLFSNLDALHSSSKTDTSKVEDSSNSSKFSDASVIDTVKEIAVLGNCTMEQAYKGTIIILNQGGTSPRAQKSIYAKVGPAKITLDMVSKGLRKIEGNNATLRKLARSFGTRAFEICKEMQVKGNLASKLYQLDPSLCEEELYWAADFQSNNPDCPSKVRDLLHKYYEENIKKTKNR